MMPLLHLVHLVLTRPLCFSKFVCWYCLVVVCAELLHCVVLVKVLRIVL